MQDVTLHEGMTITSSVKLKSAEVLLANGDNTAQTAAIVIKGDNITVDFNGSVLRGTPADADPDKRNGTGVLIQGRNVTIKNLRAHGYKIGAAARNAPGLKVLDSDFSYNWKQRLNSTLDREDSSDWMSYHQNEKDEWLRYGAGLYLSGCDNFEVKNVRIIGGQNGLMIHRSNRGRIWNNNFSFLSSLGLGMYRSSDNRIMHNNIDWCVRGYSHGKWNRGQDSAGILIYEQSHRNVFAYNSVTHGGDGFFLWAGQTTMDNGQGGCNDNLLYGNDFSHAPTNGIEATFSRNDFINNLLLENWHGIWGGFSYNSKTIANIFAYNGQAIAWEHGQDNEVTANMFYRDNEGIALWMNQRLDPNWGYPKFRDTSSRNWIIRDNEFSSTTTNSINLRDTKNVILARNTFSSIGRILQQAGSNPDLEFRGNLVWAQKEEKYPGADNTYEFKPEHKPEVPVMRGDGNTIVATETNVKAYLDRFNLIWMPYPSDPMMTRGMDHDPWLDKYAKERLTRAPKPLAGGKRPFIKKGQLRGRRFILVDEWGPYDFKRPVLWPRSELVDGKMTFELLGPKGIAAVRESKGVTIEAVSTDGVNWTTGGGEAAQVPVPGYIRVNMPSGSTMDRALDLEYRGSAVTDVRGVVTPAGQPFRFGWSQFLAPIDWDVKWYAWDPASVANPQGAMPAFKDVVKGEPLATAKVSELNYGWGGSPAQGVPADHFLTLAEGTFEITEGEYTLNVTTDDGCRVFVDDELVIKDAWKYQGPTLYTATLKLGGRHRIRVEHYEINGYSALKVELKPKR